MKRAIKKVGNALGITEVLSVTKKALDKLSAEIEKFGKQILKLKK